MLGVVDPVDVDIDPGAPLGAVPLECQLLGMGGDHRLGERAGEAVDVAEARPRRSGETTWTPREPVTIA